MATRQPLKHGPFTTKEAESYHKDQPAGKEVVEASSPALPYKLPDQAGTRHPKRIGRQRHRNRTQHEDGSQPPSRRQEVSDHYARGHQARQGANPAAGFGDVQRLRVELKQIAVAKHRDAQKMKDGFRPGGSDQLEGQ